jgi:uncharacterized protein DUF6338
LIADTGTAILILGIFVLPGFITLLFRERFYVVRGQDTPFERLLQALFYSAIVYGLILAVGLCFGLDKADVVEFHDGKKTLFDDFLAGVLIFLVLPLLLAVFGSRWNSSKTVRPKLLRLIGSSEAHNVHSGWNELFSKQGGAMIRATLSDGRVVGGFYGEPSLAGYTEHTQDLYISERWELDEDSWFVRPAPRTLGIWLPRESIRSLEVYQPNEMPAADSTAVSDNDQEGGRDEE